MPSVAFAYVWVRPIGGARWHVRHTPADGRPFLCGYHHVGDLADVAIIPGVPVCDGCQRELNARHGGAAAVGGSDAR